MVGDEKDKGVQIYIELKAEMTVKTFTADELQKEMDEDPLWWKTCVKCYFCPFWVRGCNVNNKKYFFKCRKTKP